MDIEHIKTIAKNATYKRLWTSLQTKSALLKSLEVQRELAALAGYQDFHFFVRYFFADHRQAAFSSMHADFFKHENPRARGQQEVIAAPRGHAKTTFKVRFKVIHALLYQYEPYVLILCQSPTEAKERVSQIYEELQNNERLRTIFGSVVSERRRNGLMRTFVTTSGSKVEGLSRGQSIRGKNDKSHRPSLIILDDVETLESAYSPHQRQENKDWFFKDVLPCRQTDGSSNLVVIGTCIHQESLLSELLQKPGWQASRYQAIIRHSPQEHLWQEWQTLYTDLSNPNREAEADAFFQANQALLLEGTEVLWPEMESYYDLMKLKIQLGEAAFQSEKQNEPYDPERQIFNLTEARYFELDWQGKTLRWLDGSEKTVALNSLKSIIAFHDPALGTKPSQTQTDYAAIVVVGQDAAGYCYVLDCYLEKALPDVQIQQAFRLHEQWHLRTLYVEDNQAQALFVPLYDKSRSLVSGTSKLSVVGVHHGTPKHQRIASLQPDIANGRLLFRQDLDPRFFEQLRLFPTAAHDDGPDALQGALSQLQQPYFTSTAVNTGNTPRSPLMTSQPMAKSTQPWRGRRR